MQAKNQGQPQLSPAAELAKNRQAIARLAQSGEAQKLMELLNRQGGVQQAAKAAAAGDASSLVELVNRLMKTDEGAQLVGRIEEQAQKAGLQ